jgi:hypothetical protein
MSDGTNQRLNVNIGQQAQHHPTLTFSNKLPRERVPIQTREYGYPVLSY